MKIKNKIPKIITGRRKTSVARISLKPGKGKFLINGLNHQNYFKRRVVAANATMPLTVVDKLNHYDIFVNVKGGGLSGQAGAVRYALSRAIKEYHPEDKTTLRKYGFLTRDARKVERKLYGHKKARKSFQFSKR